jgi:hypothetical protein
MDEFELSVLVVVPVHVVRPNHLQNTQQNSSQKNRQQDRQA